jgi:hypothetical protein
MTYDVVNAGVTNTVDFVDTCVKCPRSHHDVQLCPQGLRRGWSN